MALLLLLQIKLLSLLRASMSEGGAEWPSAGGGSCRTTQIRALAVTRQHFAPWSMASTGQEAHLRPDKFPPHCDSRLSPRQPCSKCSNSDLNVQHDSALTGRTASSYDSLPSSVCLASPHNHCANKKIKRWGGVHVTDFLVVFRADTSGVGGGWRGASVQHTCGVCSR